MVIIQLVVLSINCGGLKKNMAMEEQKGFYVP
jgi:hypothetical protein